MGPIDVKMHLASFLSPRPPYTLLSLTSSYPTYPSYPLTCSPLQFIPHTILTSISLTHSSYPPNTTQSPQHLSIMHSSLFTFSINSAAHQESSPKTPTFPPSFSLYFPCSLFLVPASLLSLSLSKFTVGFSFSILEILSTFFDTNVVWVVQNLEIITAYRKCGGGKSSATGWEFHGKLGCLDSSLNPLLIQ